MQRDVAAEIAGTPFSSGELALSVSAARQMLAVDLHNSQPEENTRYLLADCKVTLIGDDDRAFVATDHIHFHAEDDRGLMVDPVDLGHFEEQAVWTIPVPASKALPGG